MECVWTCEAYLPSLIAVRVHVHVTVYFFQVTIRVLMPKGPLPDEKKIAIFEALEGLTWR